MLMDVKVQQCRIIKFVFQMCITYQFAGSDNCDFPITDIVPEFCGHDVLLNTRVAFTSSQMTVFFT